MELQVINEKGKPTAKVAASDHAFGREYNEALVHQVVIAFLANGRQGTRKQKSRGEINKSNKKPWKQKGTGRARAGRASSPLWRGGGKIFPNLPDENFTQKVNRKMYRAGLFSILSQLAREERLAVVEQFALEGPKTKALAAKLKDMGLEDVLIITDSLDDNLKLSSRNLPNVHVVTVGAADPLLLMRHAKVLVTRGAVTRIEEMLK
jgi:large subunit ribosomal protein L4